MSWALAMQASSAWEWAFQVERNFWQAFHAYNWQEDWQVWQEDEVQVPGEGMDGGKGFDGKGGEGKMGGGMDMSQGMGCGMMGGNPMMGMMGGQGMPNPQMQQQMMAQKGAMMYPMMGKGANLMMNPMMQQQMMAQGAMMNPMMQQAYDWQEDEVQVPGEGGYEQDGFFHFQEVDIGGKLVDLAFKGMWILEMRLDGPSGRFESQLSLVRHTLQGLEKMPASYHTHPIAKTDEFEQRAANSVKEIDEVLLLAVALPAAEFPPTKRLIENLQILQRLAQDVSMLLCSRFVDQITLQAKGIPTLLLVQLTKAYTTRSLQDDGLWSRLGNSKYHIFTPEEKFGDRKHRHGRGGRKSRRNKYPDDEDQIDPTAASSAPPQIDPTAASAAPPGLSRPR